MEEKIAARLVSSGLTKGDLEMELTIKWQDYGGGRIVRFVFQPDDVKMIRSLLNSEWLSSGS